MRNFEIERWTTSSKEYNSVTKHFMSKGQWACTICLPWEGENAISNRLQRSWKKFRKTKYKEVKYVC